MIASCTAMPKMEMKPIAAEMDRWVRVRSSAKTPPAHAAGMLSSTSKVSFTVPTAL